MTVNVQKKQRYRITRIYKAGERSSPSGQARRLYLLLTLITAAGVFAGAYCYNSDCGAAEMVAVHGGRGFAAQFADSFAFLCCCIALCFFSGFSALGKPAAYLLCILKGMAAGCLSACIFESGLAGADLAAAMDILPFEAMGTAIVIFAARENIRLSDIAARRLFDGGSEGSADIGLYIKKFGVILLSAAAAAAVDGIIS